MITYDNIGKIEAGHGDDYTIGCLLDYPYFNKTYNLLAIDLSKQNALEADPKKYSKLIYWKSRSRWK